MQDLIMIGSGGCMKELFYQIENLNKEIPTWRVLGYVDKAPGNVTDCAYLGDDDWLLQYEKPAAVCISVQEPGLRKKLAELYHKNIHLTFPVISMGKTEIADSVKVGEGTIFCEHVKVTNDGKIGAFGFFNIGAQIHHEAEIEDYVSMAPNSTLAGNVTIKEGAYLGMGSIVIQGKTVGREAVIGAGAVVTEDIPQKVIAAGVPAKVIKR